MEQVKLNLGSGKRRIDGFINIDIDPECKPDLVLDVNDGLQYYDNSIDAIRAFDFLEHIPLGKTIFVINDIFRVLKPGGIFEHFTPSTDGRGAFQDPTHLSFWNRNSWLYFSTGAWGGMYGIKAAFEMIELRDIITSDHLNIIHTHGIFKKPEQTK